MAESQLIIYIYVHIEDVFNLTNKRAKLSDVFLLDSCVVFTEEST